MVQTEEEKAQKAAESRVAELEKQIELAAEKEKAAEAKVSDLESQLEATRLAAPAPLPSGGTITVNAAGKVVS